MHAPQPVDKLRAFVLHCGWFGVEIGMEDVMAADGNGERVVAENARARSRLLRRALILGASLLLLASLCFVVASHVGFEHVACKMAEDALSSALSHARSLARRIQDAFLTGHRDAIGAVRENSQTIRNLLQTLAKDDPTVLYGMLLSSDREILVHTEARHERDRAGEAGRVSPLCASAREFPAGRMGYQEAIYEVRTPLVIGNDGGHVLVLGLSKRAIDNHIDEVRRGVRLRMLLAAAIGLAVLGLPAAGLWFALKRYRQLATKAQDMALMAQVGRMANGLAHEIRNPLNALRFNLKIMEEDADHFPEDVRDGYLQIIRRGAAEVNRLDDLVSEYLSYVRPGRGEPEPLDLNTIVESVLGFVEYECRRHNIHIERNLSRDLPRVLVDERQIKQVVLNVVVNAKQALSDAGGNIRVISCQHNGMVELEIADDGPGVSEEDRARIFEPFYTGREGGIGLGLAIARRIVEAHGGTIQCRREAGQGAAFVMTFAPAPDGHAREE